MLVVTSTHSDTNKGTTSAPSLKLNLTFVQVYTKLPIVHSMCPSYYNLNSSPLVMAELRNTDLDVFYGPIFVTKFQFDRVVDIIEPCWKFWPPYRVF